MSQAEGDGRGAAKPIGCLLVLALGAVVVIPAAVLVIMAGFVAQTAAMGACLTGPQSGQVFPSDGSVRLPLKGKYTYTSTFGMRDHPVLGITRLHAGADLAMIPTGGPVLAAKAGTIRSVTYNAPGAGNFVVIDHGGGLSTRYLHMASISVRADQAVQVGQKIGVEGNTTGPGASISTGAHLHFEVRKNGQPTNPAQWLKKHGVNLPPLGGTSTAGSGSAVQGSADVEEVDVEVGSSAGGGFELPQPNMADRQDSLHTPPMTIPPDILKLYKEAASKYGLPWELLAGVGMTETHHGRDKGTSSAGATGHMQFMPAAWIDHGVDGDGDGQAEITNTADSIHSAANKLRDQGATESPEGVEKAILRYNVSRAYLADVLYYAHQYGNGEVSVTGGSADDCGAVDLAAASGATSSCPETSSPAENGLTPAALNGLRCGKNAFPWIKTMHGVGERAIADDHPQGRAVDFMIPNYTSRTGNERGWRIAKWFQRNASALNVKYLIFDQKIWSVERADEGWRPMEDRGSPTANHRDHLHLSISTV